MKNIFFDLVVIGGGPAGMMAAGRAAELGADVVLIEKNEKLGRKLLLTGKGRCNITHAEFDNAEFLKEFGKNGKFLFPSFSIFGPKETIAFFESRGVKTKVERGKRIFPLNGSAVNILNCLIGYMKKGGVIVKTNTKIVDVKISDLKEVVEIITNKKEKISAKNYILATGGKTFPQTGSTGDGYILAKKIGHEIISLEPAIVPLVSNEKWAKKLAGLSLKNVEISIFQNGKKITDRFGELLFTHFGISGPIAMDVSKEVGRLLKTGKVEIVLDLKPALTLKGLDNRLQRDFSNNPQKYFKNILHDLLPANMIDIIIGFSGISENKKGCEITKTEREKLAKTIKEVKINIEKVLGFEHAVVTAGGIDLKEIDSRTMRSKIIKNLFFAGEIIDIDGPSGGYNLQNCWTTGYVAGENATKGLIQK
jgi:predicted Rossmann fold flavoprotein